MKPRINLLFVVVCALLLLAAASAASAQKSKLTQSQVDQLIKSQAPDDLVASQIRSRGVSFVLTHKMAEDYAAKKAGPQTLAALREQVRAGGIRLQTEVNALILLDGKEAGTVGNAGLILLADLPEGRHDIVVRKEGFKERHLDIALASNEVKQVALPLDWMGGYLTISSQPAAAIHVTGPQTFDGAGTDLKCQPGSYTLTASQEGYVSQSRTFQVAAGEHHAESVKLAVDPDFVNALLSTANQKFAASDFRGATETTRRILAIDPLQAQALRIAAEAYWRLGDGPDFVAAAGRAVAAGEAVTIPLMHVHNFPHPMVHEVTLTIDKAGITYTPPSATPGCKLQKFTEPFSAMRAVSLDTTVRGAPAIDFQFIQPKSLGGFIKSDVDEHGNPILRLSFLVVGSEARTTHLFGNPDPNYVPFASPANAQGLILGAVNFITQIKR